MPRLKASMLPFAPAALLLALGACQSEAERQADRTGDIIEQQAEASAESGGAAIVAFGMTEAELIDADLMSSDGTELGDVEQVRRDAAGQVDRLVVEIEDSNPDRFVLVPMEGLSAHANGEDIVTTMNAADLAALPDAPVQGQAAATPPA